MNGFRTHTLIHSELLLGLDVGKRDPPCLLLGNINETTRLWSVLF